MRKGILDLKSYVPGKPIEEVRRELDLKDVIKLAFNDTSVGLSPLALEAIKKEIKNINFYPESSSRALREKFAHKLKIDKEMIIIGNGADKVIDFVGIAFINGGDEVITREITFPAYKTITKIMGRKLISVKLKDFRFDLEKNAQRINDKNKIIFICNPNNPTGAIVGKEAVDRFTKQVPEDVVIVFGETYYDYVEDKNYPNSLFMF